MTYSIVARDPATGEIGVAVQSHYFGVGRVVHWAEAGVGAVATQSFVDPAYGPLGLRLMRRGLSAADTLAALVSVDADEDRRQVAVVDAAGTAAVHTGARCVPAAGHRLAAGYCAQANMMERDTVWDAMADAFGSSAGDLADRLLAALDAAEAEGGDIRGRQSAAIVIVGRLRTGTPWRDRLFDLRVEDHPDPLPELRRLVALKRAYDDMDRGDDLIGAGRSADACRAYARAQAALGPNVEASFWAGVALADAGDEAQARPLIGRAVVADARWAELLRRLPGADLLRDDAGLVERLLER